MFIGDGHDDGGFMKEDGLVVFIGDGHGDGHDDVSFRTGDVFVMDICGSCGSLVGHDCMLTFVGDDVGEIFAGDIGARHFFGVGCRN